MGKEELLWADLTLIAIPVCPSVKEEIVGNEGLAVSLETRWNGGKMASFLLFLLTIQHFLTGKK